MLGAMSTALHGTQTHENLKLALANEAQAQQRFAAFARDADREGRPDVAGLFRDTAAAEANQATKLLELLRPAGDPPTDMPVGRTEDDLKTAYTSERERYEPAYQAFATLARAEGFEDVARCFESLAKTKRNQAARFKKALDGLAF